MIAARIAAALTAAALAVAAFFVAFIGVFVGADAADPADPASTGEALALGAGFVVIEGLLLSGTVWLALYAGTGAFPRARWLLLGPLACLLLLLALAVA
jgi:hypothetical protein